MTENNKFPKDFLWGTATSSYQIEGAAFEDGKGLSIWDSFCRKHGKIKNGDTGETACDHYHRWQEDLQLLVQLGVNAYRFSISWPRIFPEGTGINPNQHGLDFYSRLVDGLLDAGIKPCITLYHWDLPQSLQNKGGWMNRSTAKAFAEYADTVTRSLGDRVQFWITHNEPLVSSFEGHLHGNHAPGKRNLKNALSAAHHLLLSHGLAVPVIRANVKQAEVGITLNLSPVYQASSSKHDHQAAKEFDGRINRWFLDPVLFGTYPAEIKKGYIEEGQVSDSDLDFIKTDDLKIISAPIDFLGVNYYGRSIIRSQHIPEKENSPVEIEQRELTDIGWEIYPKGLFDLLKRINKLEPKLDIYITENGAAYNTNPDESGKIRDEKRIAYLNEHIEACQRCITVGIPLKGYFLWTLMDNFEWAHGYQQRFGITWVDFKTQKRIPKESFWWYKKQIEK